MLRFTLVLILLLALITPCAEARRKKALTGDLGVIEEIEKLEEGRGDPNAWYKEKEHTKHPEESKAPKYYPSKAPKHYPSKAPRENHTGSKGGGGHGGSKGGNGGSKGGNGGSKGGKGHRLTESLNQEEEEGNARRMTLRF